MELLPAHMRSRLRAFVNFNSSRVHLERFIRAAAASVPPGAHVLDAGAGDGRYRPLFAHTILHATDFLRVEKPYDLARLDFVSTLTRVPAANASYDLVLCTQVLEHLPDPRTVLAELARVLKPGGALWLSAPLFYEEHEVPYDFFRYTQYGLRQLLEEQSLRVERLEWLEGYYGTLAYQLMGAARSLPVAPPELGRGRIALAPLMLGLKGQFLALSLLFARLDASFKQTNAGYNKNYVVVARKA